MRGEINKGGGGGEEFFAHTQGHGHVLAHGLPSLKLVLQSQQQQIALKELQSQQVDIGW